MRLLSILSKERRSLLASLLLVLLSMLIVSAVGEMTLRDRSIFWNPLLHHSGDVWEYYHAGLMMLYGLVPYRDFPLEYPPLATVPFLLPFVAVLGKPIFLPTYVRLLLGENAILSAVIAVVLARMVPPAVRGEMPRRLTALSWYALLVFLLSPLLPWRYDLFPALMTLLALQCVLGRRGGMAGVWLGFGIAAKLYPLVLMPVFLAYFLVQKDRRAAGRLLVGTSAACLGSILPFIPAGTQMLSFVQYHQHRGIEIGSVPGGLLLLANHVAHIPLGLVFNYGAFHLVTPLTTPILKVLPLTALLVFSAILTRCVRRFQDDQSRHGKVTSESLVVFIAAILLGFILTNKVFSPQYMIWLLPFIPLLRARFALGLTVVCALTIVIFPFGFTALLGGEFWIVLVLNVRNLLVLGLLCDLLRDRGLMLLSSPTRFLPIMGAKPILHSTSGEVP